MYPSLLNFTPVCNHCLVKLSSASPPLSDLIRVKMKPRVCDFQVWGRTGLKPGCCVIKSKPGKTVCSGHKAGQNRRDHAPMLSTSKFMRFSSTFGSIVVKVLNFIY